MAVKSVKSKKAHMPKSAPSVVGNQSRKVNLTTAWHQKRWVHCVALLTLTFISFLPVMNAGFINIDDNVFVSGNNSFVHHNLVNILTHNFQGNLVPVTMFSLYTNYISSGFDPTVYHAWNLVFHLLGMVLLFLWIYRISGGLIWVASITAILFGIYPMHVESVAWISERRDVLYVAFFFGALILYNRYLERDNKKKWYALTLLFFAFSLLSKAMAVTLPVVLLLVDYYRGRSWNMKVLLEKIPFFALSLLVGYLAFKVQIESGAVYASDFKEEYSHLDQMRFACYGLVSYVTKLFVPVDLSVYYPYPLKEVGYPLLVRISWMIALFSLVISGALLWYFRKNEVTRTVLFGILFFGVTIFPVLQFIPVGSAIMADRYSYLPYCGLFLALAGLGYVLWEKASTRISRNAMLAVVGLAIVCCGIATYSRALEWKDSQSLLGSSVDKYPCAYIYEKLGELNLTKKGAAIALIYLNKSLALDSMNPGTFINMAEAHILLGNTQKAMADCEEGIKRFPNYYFMYYQRGNVYGMQRKLLLARKDFQHALDLNPNVPGLYRELGKIYQYYYHRPDSAGIMYRKATELEEKL